MNFSDLYFAIQTLRKAAGENKVNIEDRDLIWLDTMENQLDSITMDEEEDG